MARGRFGRSKGRSRSSTRKIGWYPFQFAGNSQPVTIEEGTNSTWVSLWARWPSGENDSSASEPGPMPVDETLVRYIGNISCAWVGAAATFEAPIDVCFGLIAFDGGNYPDYYDLTAHVEGSSTVAPPNPLLEADDDWIIRVPFLFTTDSTYGSVTADTFLNSKAMRKLPPGRGILAVIAFGTVLNPTVATPTISWYWDGRLACKSGYTPPSST